MSDLPHDQDPQAAMRAILDAWAAGDLRRAGRLSDAAVLQHPDSPELWALQVHCLLWRGRREEARAAEEKARALGPENAYVWAAVADRASFEACYDDARAAADRAMALNATDPWILERCANAYSATGDPATAERLLLRWRELHPDDEEPIVHQITHLVGAGRTAEAEALLAEAERRFPESPRFWVPRARFLMRTRRLDECVALRRRIAEALPGSPMAWAELAQILSFTGPLEEAEAAARRSLEINTCSTVAMGALAKVCQERGQTAQAAEWRERAANAIPALRVQRYNSDANAAMRRGDWDKALACAEEALSARMQTTRTAALGIKVRALLALKRLDEAEATLETLRQSEGESATVYELTGDLCLARGRAAEAVPVLRDGVARYPAEGIIRARLIRALHAIGAADEARQVVEGAFEHFPAMPVGVTELYMALSDAGYAGEARRLKRLGRERFPDSPELRLFDAVDKVERGDIAGALRDARGLGGEWAGVARQVEQAASFIGRVKRLLARLGLRGPGQTPPTMH